MSIDLLTLNQHISFSNSVLLPQDIDYLEPTDNKRNCFDNVTIYGTDTWSGEGTEDNPYEIDSLFQDYCSYANSENYSPDLGEIPYSNTPTSEEHILICVRPCQFKINTSGTLHYEFLNLPHQTAYNDLFFFSDTSSTKNYLFRGSTTPEFNGEIVSGSMDFDESFFDSSQEIYLTISTDGLWNPQDQIFDFSYANSVKIWFAPYSEDAVEPIEEDEYKPNDSCECGSLFFPVGSKIEINNQSYALKHTKDVLINRGQKLITSTSIIHSESPINVNKVSIDFGEENIDNFINFYNKVKFIIKTSDGDVIASKVINGHKQVSRLKNNRIDFHCSNILGGYDIANKLVIVEIHSICDFSVEPCCEHMPEAFNIVNQVNTIKLPSILSPPATPPDVQDTQIPIFSNILTPSVLQNDKKKFSISGLAAYDEYNDDHYAYNRLNNGTYGVLGNIKASLRSELFTKQNSVYTKIAPIRAVTQSNPSERDEINDVVVTFESSFNNIRLNSSLIRTDTLYATIDGNPITVPVERRYTTLVMRVFSVLDTSDFINAEYEYVFWYSMITYPSIPSIDTIGCIDINCNPLD